MYFDSPETELAQQLSDRFEYLTQLVYLTSGITALIGILGSLLVQNAGVAIAGIGSAAIHFSTLSANRDRAARTAATLLLNRDTTWQLKLTQAVTPLTQSCDALTSDRQHLQDQLQHLQEQLQERDRQIDALNGDLIRLQQSGQALVKKFKQTQAALNEKRHALSVHLDAIEGQILDIWTPLYTKLIAICDRFDPSRPVADLEYAGKPVRLTEEERRNWQHYRKSLIAYDSDLRTRIHAMSEDCESHDEAYAFFLSLLEELTTNYCKLWARVKDLELLTVHEEEKRLIYSEFETLRQDYVSEASAWVEKSTTVEQGFYCIEESFKHEIASLQQRIIEAERLIESLQSPRLFRGETSIDKAGNQIIKHFAESSVILDAIESVKIPGGFQLRFKVDRNPDRTRLAESEFDKHCDHLGLWGLSQRPLDFDLDTRNFLLSVNLYTVSESKPRHPTPPSKRPGKTIDPTDPSSSNLIADRFLELECYSAAEFEEVVRLKFVPRVRVVAGSTGGKSPLLELIGSAIAQIHKGELWLINPIPGSEKDWFHVPGVIPSGTDGIAGAVEWLVKAHSEFKARRNDLPGTASKPFITVMVDEINAIARDFPDLGTVMKDFYQLSDHTRMGFLTAGQGGNVSGVSGGSQANRKTGNASKLMEEDFQNATQVFTAAAAKTWIEKYLKGSLQKEFLDRLTALNQLCIELNEAEGKSAYPTDPTRKTVSPDAYRIALAVSPKDGTPFFLQIPPYSHYRGRLSEVSYPPGATITAPLSNQQSLGLIGGDRLLGFTCEYCGHQSARRKGSYKSGQPKYICSNCGRVPSSGGRANGTDRTE